MSEAMLARADEYYQDVELENGLTLDEVAEGYEMCPVFGKINIGKAMKQRAEAARSEYEAFDNMHRADGIFSKSNLRL